MIPKKSLGLGSVALVAVLVTTGCSLSTYGPVPPEQGQGVIAAWDNKAATVKCSKDEYAVFSDKERDKDQECSSPPWTNREQKPVYDLDLVKKYPCNDSKKFLAYVEGRSDLVFCFRYKYSNQEPDPKKFK
ncbi:hypothetical protein [Shimazuella kribbensis]|uniref:hypothetical protein n=1 Tax=Shimazuella kribbensis TaxID=139808 RepID=UPI0012EB2302|nr:hypothetical protein [Shimazuella kribbensis]